MVTITNTTGGLKGFAHVRFPVGASTHSKKALEAIADHPHFRVAVDRGDLVISEGEAAADAPDVHRGAHEPPAPPRELTDDELLEQMEREEAERLKSGIGAFQK